MQKANTFSFTHKNYENGLECDVMFMSLFALNNVVKSSC